MFEIPEHIALKMVIKSNYALQITFINKKTSILE